MRNIIILFFLFCAVGLSAQTLGNSTLFKAQSGNDYWQVTWQAMKTDINAGAGTVTSVGLALPSIFSVTNSPVTTTGTLTGTLVSQTANHIFAAPDGSAGTPVFRAMTANDVPTLPASKVTGAAVTAASARITLGGIPSTAALSGYSIDVNEGQLNLASMGGTLPLSKGGTGLGILGVANTVLASNGTSLQYSSLTYTSNAAANGWTGLNLNIAPASTSLPGLVTTGTQSFVGSKNFTGNLFSTNYFEAFAQPSTGTPAITVRGAINYSLGSTTTSFTFTEQGHMLRVPTLTSTITVSLPQCNSIINNTAGRQYTITKSGTDAFGVIIDPDGSQTFADGAPTKTLYGQGNSITCTCFGTGASAGVWEIQQ